MDTGTDATAGSALLERIADLLERLDDGHDWRYSLMDLAVATFAAGEAFLAELDLASRQLQLYVRQGRPIPPQAATGCLTTWQEQAFYTPLPPTALPELLPHRSTETTGYLAIPVHQASGRDTGTLLILAYDREIPLSAPDLKHGHRILSAHARALQVGTHGRPVEEGGAGEKAAPPWPTLALVEPLFDSAPILIDGFDKRGRCILWNRQCVRVFGWSADEVKAKADPLALFYPDEAEYRRVMAGLASQDGSVFQEWTPRTRDGRQLTTLWANVALPDGAMICIGHDITEQRQAEQQRRLAASVFESSYDAIMITDADHRVCDVNPAFTRITGYAREEILGRSPDLLCTERLDVDPHTSICRHLTEHDSWEGELLGRRRNGERYTQRLSVSAVRDDQGRLLHHVATFSDITHRKRHEDELRYLARHDALTELPNRRHFAEHLEAALTRARRDGELLAVCFLDLDDFKPINDRFGHAAGDALLVVVGKRLRHALRTGDLLARLGGDEFALLLSGLHDREECLQVVERLRHVITRPITLDDSLVRVSSSIGITLFPQDDVEAEILLRHADQAMYRAKRSGKNHYCVFDAGQRLEEQHSLRQVARLERALLDGEFVLHYQPKVDLRTGEACGLEALLRWQHPEHGLLGPADFLSMAMGTRIEAPLGDWVIDEVLDQANQWRDHGQRLRISFNASANHLALPEFSERIVSALHRYPGLSGEQLEVEFQEGAAVGDLEAITHSLSRCREAGLSVALDDFGTGYSSLSHLRELPIDTLKIDKEFIAGLLHDERDAALVQGIIQISGMLGLGVIAEGAESSAHCRRLLQLGCPIVQGYALATPMPAERVLTWLASRRT